MKIAVTILATLLTLPLLAEEIKFTAKPTATKAGETVKIAFAVSAATDVAIFIEDAQGKVVRHLAAGVLGKNAPPPFKPDALTQEVEWDGKADYGKPAEGGPFKVRVALGLGAKYDKVLSSRPLSFAGSGSLATGPDGTLYLRHQNTPSVWQHSQIVVLNRDGSYRRTMMPYASTPGNEEARGMDAMEVEGRLVPAGRENERDICTAIAGPGYSSLAVSADGKELYGLAGAAGVLRLSTAGGCPEGPLVSQFEKGKNGLGPAPVFFGSAYAALSSDGKHLYMNGVSNQYAPAPFSAIFRVSIPDRKVFEVFFGDPKTPGADAEHLSAVPGGMACDGKGNLLIADVANNRVLVLNEADGKFKAELKIDAPRAVGVDARSGAVYVSSEKNGAIRLVKFNGWHDAKQVSEGQFRKKGWSAGQSMAVDASADPAVIWITAGGDGQLLRVEDRGSSFESTEISGDWRSGQMQECYLSVTVDRNTREVYARNGGSGGIWERFNDDTGKDEKVQLPSEAFSDGGGKGTQLAPAPNGNLYGIKWEHSFYQWDRNGKPVTWTEPRQGSEAEMKVYTYDKSPAKGNASYVPVGMTEQPHTLGVRWSDGHLFVLEPLLGAPGGGRTCKALHEYLPSGKRVTTPENPIIWKTSDAVVGPKFDAAGNIYVADYVRPKGWVYPPEIKTYLDGKGVTKLEGKAAMFTMLYGSIVKFSSKGGMLHWEKGPGPDGRGTGGEPWYGPDPFTSQPKLDASLKESMGEYFVWNQLHPLKVTGAEWIHPGIGNVGMFRCNCENVTFDVDEFGRVFFPDFCLFRICVIDTAGNAITHFGNYGNPENCGPDSPVIDPKSGLLRARRADDPAQLKSPYSEPDIAMAWPAGIGVTDKHAYIGDPVNRRLLRTRLVYAAEESCAIK